MDVNTVLPRPGESLQERAAVAAAEKASADEAERRAAAKAAEQKPRSPTRTAYGYSFGGGNPMMLLISVFAFVVVHTYKFLSRHRMSLINNIFVLCCCRFV